VIARCRMFALALPLLLVSLVLAGCAGRQLKSEGEPVMDASASASRLMAATLPAGPRRTTFTWNLREGRTRLSGQGVARYEAPDHLRLDLFGPRGETYLSAALVDGRFRLPPTARDAIALPSASLLWAALGIFQPPTAARLVSVTVSGDVTSVRYGAPDGEMYDFRFMDSPRASLLSSVERAGTNGITESLELQYDDSGVLLTANYRNWADFRDLEIHVEKTEDATSFQDEIWLPGGSN